MQIVEAIFFIFLVDMATKQCHPLYVLVFMHLDGLLRANGSFIVHICKVIKIKRDNKG